MSRPVPPPGAPSDDERAETRRAVRLVAACAAVALALYAGLVAVVTEEAWFTRVGRTKGVMFALKETRDFDRAARAQARPITWVVGTSVARDAFDAAHIEGRLAEAGSEHAVVNLSFNRGTAVFAGALLDDLPVRPGDRIVTTVAEDNFVWDWLSVTADFSLYVQSVLSPSEIARLRDVPIPTRVEWSLGSVMPASFVRSRDDFRKGFEASVAHAAGLRERAPEPRDQRSPFVKSERTLRPTSKQDWTFDESAIVLGPGQTHWDGLVELQRRSVARGADLVVVYVPAHPWYYERFITPATVEHFHATMQASGFRYERLRARQGGAYRDFKHPNNKGRPGFSDELADLLLRAEGLDPGPRPEDPWLDPLINGAATPRVDPGSGG